MNTLKRKDERLDIRLSASEKALLQKAAIVRQEKVSDYVRKILLSDAQKCLQESGQFILSDKDRDLFLEALDSPPEPNEVLTSAFKKYADKYL